MKIINDEGAFGEEKVLEFLRDNPDLLTRYPELVVELRVPHPCGGAVSLVEHQVSVLRDRNRRLKRQLRELIENARDNQALVQRLLRLSLNLFECRDVGEIVDRIYCALTDDFEIELATVRLFSPPQLGADRGLAEFVDLDDQTRNLFEHVLQKGKPVCGRLHPAQLDFLFGTHRAEIGSSALLPLGEAGRIGMLAMGSRDPGRFHPAQGTEFLSHVAELLTRAIKPYLQVA